MTATATRRSTLGRAAAVADLVRDIKRLVSSRGRILNGDFLMNNVCMK